MAREKPPFRAGDLRHRIDYYAEGGEQDASGAFTINKLGSFPARVQELRGDEVLAGENNQATEYNIRVSYRRGPPITADMSVGWKGRMYTITSPPRDVGTRGFYFEFDATEEK